MRGPRPARATLVGAVVAALVAALLALGAGCGGGDDGGTATVSGVDEVLAMVQGIPQSGDRLGRPNAPVTITEFADLQCPACAQASETLVPELIERYVRPGKAALVFRPLAFIGPDSTGGALGAVAAADQGKVWPFAEILYKNQGSENSGWLSDELMRKVAESIPGMDVAAWEEFRQSQAATAAVEASISDGDRQQVTSTPTFVVTGPRGTETKVGAVPLAELEEAIAAVQ